VQPDLFADRPRARVSDPETSHKAAARIKASGALGRQQGIVKAYVEEFPGRTSAELAYEMALARDGDGAHWHKYRAMVARRLPELSPIHIRKGEAMVCDVTGAESLTWWPR
jgi:hypothetical protein